MRPLRQRRFHGLCDAVQMARIHAAAFVDGRAWSETEFAALLCATLITVFEDGHGFVMMRQVFDVFET